MRPLWGSKGHLGSFWQFLAIFVKSKKRASAPSREQIYIYSVWTPLSIFKNLARWHPVQKNYSRLKLKGNHATYKVQTNMISDALNFCLISSSTTHRTIASSSDNDEFASSVSITFFSKLSFWRIFIIELRQIKPWNDHLWYVDKKQSGTTFKFST